MRSKRMRMSEVDAETLIHRQGSGRQAGAGSGSGGTGWGLMMSTEAATLVIAAITVVSRVPRTGGRG